MNVGSAWVVLLQRENSYTALQRSLFAYQAVMDFLYLVSTKTSTFLILLTTNLTTDLHLADVQFTRALHSVRPGGVSPPDASSLPPDEHLAHGRAPQPALYLAHRGASLQGPQGAHVCLGSLYSTHSNLRLRLQHPQVSAGQNCPA